MGGPSKKAFHFFSPLSRREIGGNLIWKQLNARAGHEKGGSGKSKVKSLEEEEEALPICLLHAYAIT